MIEREKEVKKVLASLLPAMETDGGGIELIAIEGCTVKVSLRGACLFCPSQNLTMKLGIEKNLKEQLPWIKEVIKMIR